MGAAASAPPATADGSSRWKLGGKKARKAGAKEAPAAAPACGAAKTAVPALVFPRRVLQPASQEAKGGARDWSPPTGAGDRKSVV